MYIASGTVVVSPGILPAKTIVAQNSEKALANPNTKPAKIPLQDNGMVIAKKVLKLPAPNPRADCSSLKSTD